VGAHHAARLARSQSKNASIGLSGRVASSPRIGKPRDDDDRDLFDRVRIPSEVVLQQQDNPTGEGVICHWLSWIGSRINLPGITVWCFVTPFKR
jgi:hypothetical protein